MKRLIVLMMIFATNMLFAGIGEVSVIKGEALVLRSSESISVYQGMQIETKDIIKTKTNAKLQIVFKDNTIISLGQKSTFKIEDYIFSDKKIKARFNVKGLFKSITGKIGHISSKNFKIKTQNATIGVRGTTVIGESRADADTIICSSGKIIVTSLAGERVLNMGEKTVVRRGYKPSRAVRVTKEAIREKERKIDINRREKEFLLFSPKRVEKVKEIVGSHELKNEAKLKRDEWGEWNSAKDIESDFKPVSKPESKKEIPHQKQEEDLAQLEELRNRAGVKVVKYHGTVLGYVETPNNKISDGSINLNVDLGRGKIDGNMQFKSMQNQWKADINNGTVDKNGLLSFGITNHSNLNGFADGSLSGNRLEHANGSFSIKDTKSNQQAYGTFKAGR